MATPRLYKTEAVILRQRKFGEADRILTLLTPAFGKIDGKARGVRKTTSRMSGHLQPLNRCMLQLAQGRMTDVIAGCETLESFHRLREDLDRLSESLYRIIFQKSKNTNLYSFKRFFVPRWYLMSYFLPVSIFYLILNLTPPEQISLQNLYWNFTFQKEQEPFEFLLSLGFFGFILINYIRLRKMK